MTISRATAFMVVAALGLLAMVGDARQRDPGVQLRAAIEKEEVAGDLEGAIVLYRQIIAADGKNRPVTAKAMLRLGGCLEKLGQQEARKVYERLVAEYSDQAQEVTQARDRLAAISRTARESSREPRFRRIATRPGTYADGQLSPDGKGIAFTDRGAVWVVPVASRADPNATGIPTKLTGALDALGVAWSPDGRTIAFNTPTGISLVARSGGEVVEVVKDSNRSRDTLMRAISVLPDGRRVAYSRGASLAEARVYLTGGAATPTQLSSGTGASMPAVSRNGKWLAYVRITQLDRIPGSTRKLEGDVWVVPARGGDPVMVSKLPGWPTGPVWSPDGSMLAFLQTPGSEQYGHPELRVLTINGEGRPVGAPARIGLPFETYRLLAGWTADNKIGLVRSNPEEQAIYRVPAAGGRAAQISAKGLTFHPQWARDGKRIFLRWNKGQIGWMSAEGGDVTAIPLDTSLMEMEAVPGGGNSVSPDGTTIVFSGGHQSGGSLLVNIWTVPVGGGQPRRITDFRDLDTRFPCWAPDGRAVAFVARDTAKSTAAATKPEALVFQIYVVSPDGTGLRRVTSNAHQVDWSDVAWSPDGKWIAFFSREKTLSLVPVEGGESRVVADLRKIDSLLVSGVGGLSQCEIAWSPDGRELAFSSDGRLWRVGVGGGAITEVRTSLDGVRATHLDWSPDGRTIAFVGSEGGDEELWVMEDFLHLVKGAR